MATGTVKTSARKRIALVAHDNKKKDLVERVRFNMGTLLHHELSATGSTGKLLEEQLDVRALLRIAVVLNIPVACDRSSADYSAYRSRTL